VVSDPDNSNKRCEDELATYSNPQRDFTVHNNWRRQLWGTCPPTSNCLILGERSIQRRRNSDIRLHAVAYPEKQYTGL